MREVENVMMDISKVYCNREYSNNTLCYCPWIEVYQYRYTFLHSINIESAFEYYGLTMDDVLVVWYGYAVERHGFLFTRNEVFTDETEKLWYCFTNSVNDGIYSDARIWEHISWKKGTTHATSFCVRLRYRREGSFERILQATEKGPGKCKAIQTIKGFDYDYINNDRPHMDTKRKARSDK